MLWLDLSKNIHKQKAIIAITFTADGMKRNLLKKNTESKHKEKKKKRCCNGSGRIPTSPSIPACCYVGVVDDCWLGHPAEYCYQRALPNTAPFVDAHQLALC